MRATEHDGYERKQIREEEEEDEEEREREGEEEVR